MYEITSLEHPPTSSKNHMFAPMKATNKPFSRQFYFFSSRGIFPIDKKKEKEKIVVYRWNYNLIKSLFADVKKEKKKYF